jgi:hypothetical protein
MNAIDAVYARASAHFAANPEIDAEVMGDILYPWIPSVTDLILALCKAQDVVPGDAKFTKVAYKMLLLIRRAPSHHSAEACYFTHVHADGSVARAIFNLNLPTDHETESDAMVIWHWRLKGNNPWFSKADLSRMRDVLVRRVTWEYQRVAKGSSDPVGEKPSWHWLDFYNSMRRVAEGLDTDAKLPYSVEEEALNLVESLRTVANRCFGDKWSEHTRLSPKVNPDGTVSNLGETAIIRDRKAVGAIYQEVGKLLENCPLDVGFARTTIANAIARIQALPDYIPADKV